VAGVDAEQRGQAVEVAVAVLVVDVAALGAGDDRNLVLGPVAAHAREVHPEVPARESLELGLYGLRRGGHVSSSSSTTIWTKVTPHRPATQGNNRSRTGAGLVHFVQRPGVHLGHSLLAPG